MAEVQGSRIIIHVSSDAAKAAQELLAVDRALKSVSGSTARTSTEVGNATSAFRGVSAAANAFIGLQVVQAIGRIGSACIQGAMQMEMYRANFETMMGSAEQADAMLASLRERAARTPFSTEDLVNVTQTLMQMGTEARNVDTILQQLGDVSQGNAERMRGLALVYAQVQSQGRLLTQDMYQMINRGFNPLNEISRTTGRSMADLRRDMQNGAISAEMVAEAFRSATAEGGRFYQGQERASRTLQGQMSTYRDNIQSVTIALGEGMLPALRDIVQEQNEFLSNQNMDRWRTWGAVIGQSIRGLSSMLSHFLSINTINDRIVSGMSAEARRRAQAAGVSMEANLNLGAVTSPLMDAYNRAQDQASRTGTGTGSGSGSSDRAALMNAKALAAKSAYMEAMGILTPEQQEAALAEQQKFLADNEKMIMDTAKGIGSSMLNTASTVISGLQNIYATYTNGQLTSLNNLYNAQKKYILANTKDEKTRDAQLKALDEAKEAREAQIKNRAARQQRELSIYAAVISTIASAVGAFGAAQNIPYPGNLIVGAISAAAVTAFGAAQIAAIASTPVPSYQYGGSFTVPPGYQADSGLMRVNQGERVDVTPERFSDRDGGQMTLRVGEYEFQAMIEKMVNAAVNSGSVQIRKKGAVKVS